MQPALRRHQPRHRGHEYVDAIVDDIEWLGFTPCDRCSTRRDYFEQLYDWAELLVRDGQGLRRRPDGETIPDTRGGFGKPGIESPYRDRPVEENLDLLRRHARRGVRGRLARAARQDRHAAREHAAARPGDVPHPARAPPPHRRRLEHLPDLRLGARAVATPSRASRTRSARSSSTATGRSTTGTSTSSPLPSRRPEQTEFARLELTHTVMSKRQLLHARRRRHRRRLGRPPDADAARAAPARLSGLGDPGVLSDIGVARTNSRHEIELLEIVRPRRPERARAAPDGGAPAAQVGDHQLAAEGQVEPLVEQ